MVKYIITKRDHFLHVVILMYFNKQLMYYYTNSIHANNVLIYRTRLDWYAQMIISSSEEPMNIRDYNHIAIVSKIQLNTALSYIIEVQNNVFYLLNHRTISIFISMSTCYKKQSMCDAKYALNYSLFLWWWVSSIVHTKS